MTRATLQRKLRKIYVGLVLVLMTALIAKVLNIVPLPAGARFGVTADTQLQLAGGFYDFLKDMAVVIVTIAAAYLAGLLQRRSNFLTRLEQEWCRIVAAKTALLCYCERDNPTPDAFVAAYMELSQTIDTMRIAYKNVGETDELIGLYPYAPLHNMRRAMTTIDPRQYPVPTADDRHRVAILINASFGALRENFLEELDLEEPTTPVLRSAARRLKKPGREAYAEVKAIEQGERLQSLGDPSDDLKALQARLDEMREIEDGRKPPPPPPLDPRPV